jgi:hypothetical protein
MNHETALDQLEMDLENSLSELRKERDFWDSQSDFKNSILKYDQSIKFYNEALNGLRELKAKLVQIERGF